MDVKDTDFSGKRVLVVGGSAGIGNAVAQGFLKRGAEVHVWARKPSAKDYEGVPESDLEGIHYHQMDVSDFEAVENWQAPFDSLDVVVCAQGHVIYKRGEFHWKGFQEVTDVNLTANMVIIDKFLPMLEKTRGSAIVVSSTAAYHATVGNPAYNASKAGAVALVRTLGAAYARSGVRVNGLAPGFVPTRMTEVTTKREDRVDAMKSRIPMGRFGKPEDMAGVCLFLASPLAAYVTGQTIACDGGLVL